MDARVILVVIPEQDADSVLTMLHERKFRVTRIASTGGFWRRGSATLLIGVVDERVSEAIDLLRHRCSVCRENQRGGDEGNGVAFILNAEHFEQV